MRVEAPAMRIMIAIAGLALLGGCKSAAQKAEDAFSLTSGDAQESCQQAKRVADLYLQENNGPKHDEWRGKVQQECALARLERSSVTYQAN